MSTEPTTEMMNEVIGVFDGWVIIEKSICADRPKLFVKDKYNYKLISELKYNTSWEWLMPVGKKIRDLLSDMQKKRPPHTACHGDMIEVDIHCAVSVYDIVSAHKHMHTFITWYNEYQQKQNNEQSTEQT